MRKLTTEEFITKAVAVHGDKYDYSEVEYVGWKTPVKIICPIHGFFWKTPHQHVSQKCDCPECWKEKAKSQRKTVEEFIREARDRHGDYYDYSKVEYKEAHKKVVIICPVHGDFEQTPNNHLRGEGCSKCGRLRIKQKLAFSQEEWVATIAKVNPNIEVLGKIVNGITKVPCRCKMCGHRWPVTPNNLQREHGCPKCAQKGFLSHEQGNLYTMVDDLEIPTLMKIGVSVDAEKRKDNVLKSARKAGAGISDLYVIKTWEGSTNHIHALEKAMHKALSQYKINFPVKFDGCQEFFYYRPEVFELIEEHLKKFSKQ